MTTEHALRHDRTRRRRRIRTSGSRCVALFAAVMLPVHPVLAAEGTAVGVVEVVAAPIAPRPAVASPSEADRVRGPQAGADERSRVVDRLVELGDAPVGAQAAVDALTEADLAVLAAHPGMLQRAGAGGGGRTGIGARLVAIGHEPAPALALAAQLTPEDLAVLLRYPDMMQRAGDMSHTTQSLLIGALIVGGIVSLAVASGSSGFVMIN